MKGTVQSMKETNFFFESGKIFQLQKEHFDAKTEQLGSKSPQASAKRLKLMSAWLCIPRVMKSSL